MFGISLSELILVIVVVLLVFKPEDLPKILQLIGQCYQNLIKYQVQVNNMIEDYKKYNDIDLKTEITESMFMYRNRQYNMDDCGNITEIVDIDASTILKK